MKSPSSIKFEEVYWRTWIRLSKSHPQDRITQRVLWLREQLPFNPIVLLCYELPCVRIIDACVKAVGTLKVFRRRHSILLLLLIGEWFRSYVVDSKLIH